MANTRLASYGPEIQFCGFALEKKRISVVYFHTFLHGSFVFFFEKEKIWKGFILATLFCPFYRYGFSGLRRYDFFFFFYINFSFKTSDPKNVFHNKWLTVINRIFCGDVFHKVPPSEWQTCPLMNSNLLILTPMHFPWYHTEVGSCFSVLVCS